MYLERENALDGQREKKTESQKQEKYKKRKARGKTKEVIEER